MFVIQVRSAIIRLVDPPMVDSTYERNINADDMPLVTVCPTNQTNKTRLTELKYWYLEKFLTGMSFCDGKLCVSWGNNINLTYEEILGQVLDTQSVADIDFLQFKKQAKTVFLPRFGFCKEISITNSTKFLTIMNNNNTNDVRVLITDKSYRSYFMPDISSHEGNKIYLQYQKKLYVYVKIRISKLCKEKQEPQTRDEFKNCVEAGVQKELSNTERCLPPWLSFKNECNGTYPGNFHNKNYNMSFLEFVNNYVTTILSLNNLKQETECKKSCKTTKYIIDERELMYNDRSRGFITFDQHVHVTEKVPNYSLFNFIIDVGSSLGLWLGLSVLGMHDLVVVVIDLVKAAFKARK